MMHSNGVRKTESELGTNLSRFGSIPVGIWVPSMLVQEPFRALPVVG